MSSLELVLIACWTWASGWLLATLTLAGLLGGLVNFLTEVRGGMHLKSDETSVPAAAWLAMIHPFILSLAAAWCVPLFLSLTSSDLIINACSGKVDALLIIFGLGIVAASASRRFLEGLADKALATAVDAKETAETAEDKAEEASTAYEYKEDTAVETVQESLQFHATSQALTSEQSELLRLFAGRSRWAPSLRGLHRELAWDQARLGRVLSELDQQGLLHKLPITANRRWTRWIITELGRAAFHRLSGGSEQPSQ